MQAVISPHEPGVVPSGILAVLVHMGFFALLFFGVHWQTKISEPMIVDVWEEIPTVRPEPVLEPPPPPKVEKVEIKPPPPPPEPKVEQPTKADILLKEKQQELERKKGEAARKKEEVARLKEEARPQKEAELEERRRKELEQRQLDEQRRLQEVARKRDEAMLEDLIKKEEKNRKEAEAAARKQQSQQTRLLEEHVARIRARIQSKVVVPPGMSGNPEAHYKVTLIPGGDVLEVHLDRSSGFSAYDLAVERAIKAAEPLPVPTDPDLFQQMRVLDLKFRPLQ